METFVLITLWIISSWLIWYIFLLHYTLKFDNSFKFIIMSGKQLIKYWLYIITMLVLSGYIFLIRLNGQDKFVNIFSELEKAEDRISFMNISDIILIGIIIILIIIFVLLLCKWIYINLRQRLLALYMYYYQYDIFKKSTYVYTRSKGDFIFYLILRVKIFTDNMHIIRIAGIIWPGLFIWVEPRIFRFIIPYMMIFDIITQDGHINKIFVVLPWYYIYSLLRTSWKLFGDFYKPANTELSEAVYKSREVNGKIYRWIDVPKLQEKNNLELK